MVDGCCWFSLCGIRIDVLNVVGDDNDGSLGLCMGVRLSLKRVRRCCPNFDFKNYLNALNNYLIYIYLNRTYNCYIAALILFH